MEQICVVEKPSEKVGTTILAYEIPEVERTNLPSLPEMLETISLKIREDVIRFRTCCADPRASK
jgi:hypothetical protein